MVELIDKTHGAVTQASAFSLTHPCQIIAGHHNLPTGRHIQPSQTVQESALTRTGTADNGDALTHPNIHVYPFQNFYPRGSIIKGTNQASTL